MTTETTSQLPPCPLPECRGGEPHYHIYSPIKEMGDCPSEARIGYRCYGPHVKDQPGTQWEPIEHDQIRAGMRIRVTLQCDDCATIRVGVADHRVGAGWLTEQGWSLTGWGDSTTYEVDPATIPDPDAELIEKIGKAIRDADEPGDEEWGEDPSAETYRKLARAALDAVRAHDEAGDGR